MELAQLFFALLVIGGSSFWLFSWFTLRANKCKIEISPGQITGRTSGGQKVNVRPHIVIRVHSSAKVASYIGIDPSVRITAEAKAIVERTVALWACRFSTAEEATAAPGRYSLENELRGIATETFMVHSAIVVSIERAIGAGEQEQESEEEEPSLIDKMRNKYRVMGEVVNTINDEFDALKKKYPQVVSDPDLAGRFEEELKGDKRSATFGDSLKSSKKKRPFDRRNYGD